MALPTILQPAGTPVFLADGHSVSEDSPFAAVKYGSGHDRLRRVWTIPERVVTVRWFLEAENVDLVRAWYEDDLEAGSLEFAAYIRNLGPGMLYFAARWIDISWQMLHYGRAIVSGSLLVRGEGEGPPSPGGGPGSIGWSFSLGEDGPFAHENAGTRDDYNAAGFEEHFAGVVDYVSGTVAWSPSFAPLWDTDPLHAPALEPLSGGRVRVTWYREETGGASPYYTAGVLTLQATIDGTPTDLIEMSIADEFYSILAWGPVP